MPWKFLSAWRKRGGGAVLRGNPPTVRWRRPHPLCGEQSRTIGLGDQRNEAVDEAVAQNFERIATHRGEALTLELYKVERRTLLELARKLRASP